MAHINLRVRAGDGGRFQSIGEASDRLAFAVWVLAQRGDTLPPTSPKGTADVLTQLCATVPPEQELEVLSRALNEAAQHLLGVAGLYHARLEKARAAKAFRCELVQDLEKKDAAPKVRSCGKAHSCADQALRCAKRQYGKPGLVRIATAAAYQGDKLLLMDVTSERDSSRGRTVSCSGVWRRVPLIDGKPDMAAFEKLTQAGIGQLLLENLRGRP